MGWTQRILKVEGHSYLPNKFYCTREVKIMNKKINFLGLLVVGILLQGLVLRHDVTDQKFIDLAQKYPQIGHFSDGEGTLISPTWIVTAAHVAELYQDEKNENQTQIVIGRNQYKIEKVILHPNYEFSRYMIKNDIALVKIQSAVKDIAPAKIYQKEDELSKSIVIVGRGDSGTGLTGPNKYDKITRAATNKIDAVSERWISFGFDPPESENTTPLEGVSGPGDSGGPAFFDLAGERFIVGVSSHQSDNGNQGVYGVSEHYARVSTYSAWIKDIVGDRN